MNCNLELGWERVGIDSGEIVHVADNGEALSGRGAGCAMLTIIGKRPRS